MIVPDITPLHLGVDLGSNVAFCDPSGLIWFDWNRQVSIGDIKMPEIRQFHDWLRTLPNPYVRVTYEVPFSKIGSANHLMAMYQATLMAALQTAPINLMGVSLSNAASARVALGIRGKGTDNRNQRKVRVVEAMLLHLPTHLRPDAMAFIAYVRDTPVEEQTKDVPARFKSVTDFADACVMAHYGQMTGGITKKKAPTKSRKKQCKSKEEETGKPSTSRSQSAAA
jgi:hypothetical protein